jgi:hypothetical protein
MPRQPLLGGAQGFGLEAVDAALRVPADVHDSCLAQDAQMLGDPWSREAELARQLAGGPLALREQLYDPAPGWIGKCLEDLHSVV